MENNHQLNHDFNAFNQGILSQKLIQSVDLLNESLCNEFGSLRLHKVQRAFNYDYKTRSQDRKLSNADLQQLKDIYVQWRDTEEVVPIRYVYKDNTIEFWGEDSQRYVNFVYENTGKKLHDYKGYVTVPRERFEWRFPHAVKRGNPQYLKLIKERLKPFLSNQPIIFFEDHWGDKRTQALYITGTVDEVFCGNDLGYLEFGSWWNSFITNIRSQIGDLVFIRSWQSQKNGHPHFHAILYFKNQDFVVVRWKNEKGEISYRLPSRSKKREIFKRAWKWGNLDVQCIQNMDETFKDLLKYVTRDLEGGESDLTNALLWYFQRQAFGVSKDFLEVVWGKKTKIASLEPSDADLINANMCNSKLDLIRIEIFPTIRKELLSKTIQTSIETWEDPPPIDEKDQVFLNYLVRDCNLVECKRSEKFDVPVFMWRSTK